MLNGRKLGNISQKMLDKDPYLTLGFGMMAYRSLLLYLVGLLFCLSIIVAPVLMIYRKGQGGSHFRKALFDKWSIGNMGFDNV